MTQTHFNFGCPYTAPRQVLRNFASALQLIANELQSYFLYMDVYAYAYASVCVYIPPF